MEQWQQAVIMKLADFAASQAIAESAKLLGQGIKQRRMKELLARDASEVDATESTILDRLREATDREIAIFRVACALAAKTEGYKANKPELTVGLPALLQTLATKAPSLPPEVLRLEGRGLLQVSRAAIVDPETLAGMSVHLAFTDVQYARSLVEQVG